MSPGASHKCHTSSCTSAPASLQSLGRLAGGRGGISKLMSSEAREQALPPSPAASAAAGLVLPCRLHVTDDGAARAPPTERTCPGGSDRLRRPPNTATEG
ncbi:hypothetical protein NDU88_003297 [Pleurodeles waltl]|uniref:Uncharacterized protein n=1 Tax=Pleurodeles waltl TaxID=8319 RepID=A0AAV7UY22_PLEWA|nr:hypothetical protein NDU88_003297 [Pleurodeles waltl]